MNDPTDTRILVNGCEQGRVAADDRGLLYGDGLFETIGFHAGQAPLWDLHMQRLSESCGRLFLPMPSAALLADECAMLADGLRHAVVRITITRGCGGRAYIPPEIPEPNRILMRRAYPESQDGVDMIRSSIRLARQIGVLSGIKHLNRLEQVLIGQECRQQGAVEALVCDDRGLIVEGLSSNLVIERNGELIAPGPHPAAVSGVGLNWLRRQLGQALTERPFHIDELQPEDSIWVINSVAGLRPVLRLDGHARPVAALLDGPILNWKKLFGLV